ncbi:zinc-finger protein [Malassezia caprae]|uniref:Zinc-finger protein n=1 Tax=Malassezia caprae TaxID=1381934 RepID=A0AAF0EB10_9BASI|nr:zinc-finger protein [Malassezia caprae]
MVCAADTTLCFDPACTLPTCDQEDHVTKALTFGVLPCSCTHDMCCPPARDSVPPGLYPSDPALHSACTPACSYDAYGLGVDANCHMPMHQGWDPSLAHPGGCMSICDGFVAPTATSLGPDDPSALDMMYARQILDHCCAHCPPKSAPHAPHAAPMPEAKTPAFRASDGSVSSETACSTPVSLVSPLSSPSARNVALRGMFQCQWAECQVCVPTLEELAAHVQKEHFAQMAPPLVGKPWTPGVEPMVPAQSAAWMAPPESSWSALPAPPPTPRAPESEPPRQHRCGWINCTESFSSHAELTAHITQVHVGSGKTEYECGWVGCERAQQGRKFAQKQKVLRHIQTHTGDRPFVCSECNKRFSEANTLAQHMRIHTNERPYKCDFPGCNKAFSVVGSLTIHKRTHTGDRPFKCPYPGCGKQFSESSNLNKHIRVHRGDKPFRCPECARCFMRPDQMARHRKVHAKARAAGAPAAPAPAPAAPVAAPALVEVGGHPGTVHAHGAWVVKECLATEARFYHETCTAPPSVAAALVAWMPACYGIADEQGHWLPGWPRRALPAPQCGAYTLYLENLTAPFVRANVCDIKLGTVLYDETDPHIPPQKRAKMERKARETTSAEHGVRVTGWCAWDERAQAFALTGKEPGRAARTREDVADLLRRALGTDDARRAQLVRTHLLPRLGALRTALSTMPLCMRSATAALCWMCA